MSTQSRQGKMPTWQRCFTQLTMLGCSLTGISYLTGHEFDIWRDLLGAHSVLAWHGITGMLAILALGSALPFHLKAGLKSKRKKWSGMSQLVFLSALLITGTLLYYGPIHIRDFIIQAHWTVGLIFFVIFLLHGVISIKPKH